MFGWFLLLIFPQFVWSQFLKFSNILSKKCQHIFISNDFWYFYLNQYYYCQIWICINWIISPLVSFCKKLCISITMLLILSCKVIVSYDWIIWWLVFHKSVSYRKECVYMMECFLLILGAIHKRRLLRGGGRGSPVKADILHKPTRERRGVINSEKWADVVYGWPLWCLAKPKLTFFLHLW